MKAPIRILVFASFALAVLLFGVQSSSKALEEDLSDGQIASIKTHCTQIQATLNQLQQSDTLLRYNVGASYRILSEKLMVPLNQRIAASEFDGSGLVRVTANYNKAYQTFYKNYQDYSNSLQAASKIDCTSRPKEFYVAIDDARQKRIDLYEANQRLVELLKDYKKEFTTFRKTEFGGNT